jgi:hypothetical protein
VDFLVPEGGALVALAEVYVDESGSHADSPILAIGGYVFLKSRSQLFQRSWAQELRQRGIPYFHMKDCTKLTGHYKSWSRQGTIAHETKLIELTNKYSAFGFSAGLNEKDYEDAFRGVWRSSAGTGYSLLLRNTLFAVKGWADRVGFKGKIVYFFEAGHRDAAQSNAIMNRIFSDPQQRENYRYAAHSYVDKMDALPLQPADLLAWLARDSIMKLNRGEAPRKDAAALDRRNDFHNYFDADFLSRTRAKLDLDLLTLPPDSLPGDYLCLESPKS